MKTYKTIQSALDAAPARSKQPYVVRIKAGRYYEKLEITRPNVTFIGEGQDKTVLTYDAFSGLDRPGGKAWGTWGCETLIVKAPDFRAESLTIENGYDYNANDVLDKSDPKYTNAPQAVALMTDTGSDRAVFYKVKVTGFQDTLFVNAGRAYFYQSYVSGHVDFIFGAGQAVFEDSDIITRPRLRPDLKTIGYVTAPSTKIADPYGLVFINSRLKKENDKVPANSSPLGRPWHPTASLPDGRYADPDAIGASTFIDCWMDDHIAIDGWASMTGTGRAAGTKDTFLPDNPKHARFLEHGSKGPGAPRKDASKMRDQLTGSAEQAKAFTAAKVFGDWAPQI
ncbi:MAG: hypothetical protein BSR46_04775 [Candidatus Dactylopiibacterium carminicum]|nr:MAG: hypothetical protein BSR46_04775 [Candidatus Dactylopiibacterium carminicum]